MSENYSVPVAYNKSSLAFAGLLGYEASFPNRSTTDGSILLDSGKVKCIWVNNALGSGTAAARALIYAFSSTFARQKIGAKAGAVAVGASCIVPKWYGASIADTYNFWAIIEGPATFTSDGTGALAQEDMLQHVANGKVAIVTLAPGSDTATLAQANSRVGRAEASCAAVDGTEFRGYFSSRLG